MDLISTHPVKQSDLGFNGTLFGGKLLYWVDGDAVAYAMAFCDSPRMVTVSIDSCHFQKPAGPSHLIRIYAFPVKIGRTSLTLNVEARKYNIYDESESIVLSTNIKFVRVDEDGNPIPISERVKNKFKLINEQNRKTIS